MADLDVNFIDTETTTTNVEWIDTDVSTANVEWVSGDADVIGGKGTGTWLRRRRRAKC